MWIFAGFLGHFMIANQMSSGFGAVCWTRKESEDYFGRAEGNGRKLFQENV